MYKGYFVNNGRVMVSDEKGNFSNFDYSDNLEQILIQKNIIEVIEKEIQMLEESKDDNIPPQFDMISLKACGKVTLAVPFVSLLFCSGDITSKFGTTMGPISNYIHNTLVLSFISIVTGACLIFCEYSIDREKQQVYEETDNAINSELDFLRSQLNVEIEKLNDLEERKVITNTKIENNYSKLIDDSEQLRQLRELMNLYYNFGLNREKYYRYYQNGILIEKLQDKYSDSELQLAKNYFQRIEDETAKIKKKSFL